VTTTAYSAATGLACTNCGARRPLGPHLLGCEACRRRRQRGALAVEYGLERADAGALGNGGAFWGYHRFLPVLDAGHAVTLGEGGTPLLPLPRLAHELGLADLRVKCEGVNPTLSYKDRTNAVAVAVARQFGYDRICCSSSGNHGVSLAAYAAAAGLRSLVLFPPQAPPSVVAEVRHYGGEAVIVTGDVEGAAAGLIEALHREHGWFISNRNAPLPEGRRYGNPFGLDGYKTIAYEIWRQLDGRLPTWCAFPVGGGDGLAGLWRGFQDLVALGLAPRGPRMLACQPEAGASVVLAWARGRPEVEPVATEPTIALSLVDRQSGDLALRAVRESDGQAVAVPDEALRDAGRALGHQGIAVEPSSAAGLAAFRALARAGALGPHDTAVFVATGAGLRWPATYDHVRDAAVPRIPAELEALRDVIRL
jgi:threonine synthase